MRHKEYTKEELEEMNWLDDTNPFEELEPLDISHYLNGNAGFTIEDIMALPFDHQVPANQDEEKAAAADESARDIGQAENVKDSSNAAAAADDHQNQNLTATDASADQQENVTDNSDQQKDVTDSSDQLENVTDNSDQQENVTDNSDQQKDVTDSSNQQENVTDNSDQQENVTDNSDQQKDVTDSSNQQENVTDNSDQQENVTDASEQQENVTAASADQETEKMGIPSDELHAANDNADKTSAEAKIQDKGKGKEPVIFESSDFNIHKPIPAEFERGESSQGSRVPVSNVGESSQGSREALSQRTRVLSNVKPELRFRGWLIRQFIRPNNIMQVDRFYIHIESRVQFRSLNEVDDFLQFGYHPARQPKKSNVDAQQAPAVDENGNELPPKKRSTRRGIAWEFDLRDPKVVLCDTPKIPPICDIELEKGRPDDDGVRVPQDWAKDREDRDDSERTVTDDDEGGDDDDDDGVSSYYYEDVSSFEQGKTKEQAVEAFYRDAYRNLLVYLERAPLSSSSTTTTTPDETPGEKRKRNDDQRPCA